MMSYLLYSFVINDTRLVTVWMHSSINAPLIYRVAGVWSNHQGSMLMMLAFFSAACISLKSPLAKKTCSLFLYGLILYVLFCANPFVVFNNPVNGGRGFNPALQSNYVAFHPPVLYLGYALIFRLWAKALVCKMDSQIQILTLACIIIILTGISLGGLWAYQELGWGGFWFWDPVETASLLPLITLGAAIHTHNLQLKYWATLLAFPLTFLAITLIRSGLFVSVHSFEQDVNGAIWLGFLCLIVIVTTIIVGLRNQPNEKIKLKKEVAYVALLVCLGVILFVVIAPLIIAAISGVIINFDKEFFKKFLNPLLVILTAFCYSAPNNKFLNKNILISLLMTGLWVLNMQPSFNKFSIGAVGLAFLVLFSVVLHCKELFKKGFILAHFGVGLFILGASHSECFTITNKFLLSDEVIVFEGQKIKLENRELEENAELNAEIFNLKVNDKKVELKIKHYPMLEMTKHDTAWVSKGFNNIQLCVFYINNMANIELTFKPLINIMWFGILLIILGLIISIKNKIRIKNSINSA